MAKSLRRRRGTLPGKPHSGAVARPMAWMAKAELGSAPTAPSARLFFWPCLRLVSDWHGSRGERPFLGRELIAIGLRGRACRSPP